MRQWGHHIAVAGALGVLLTACTGGPARVCDPGQTVACAGPTGCQGRQVCDLRGAGFGACACGGDAGAGDSLAPGPITYPWVSTNCIFAEPCVGAPPAIGGGAPRTLTITPALPAGLELSPVTGALQGTPTVLSPPTTYTVTAANDAGSAQATVEVRVSDAPPAALVYAPAWLLCRVGTPCALAPPQSTGGVVRHFTLQSALPAGLALDEATGAIAGTPLNLAPLADYTIFGSNTEGTTPATVHLAVTGVAVDVSPSPTLDLGRVAWFPGANPASQVTRRLVVRNVGSRPAAPNLAANLHLGPGGTPKWTLAAIGPDSSPSEVCVGRFDERLGTCLGDLPTTGPGAYDPVLGLVAGATPLDIPIRVMPTGPGARAWRLVLNTDDALHAQVTIDLRATAVVVPECTVTVAPTALALGGVVAGSPREASVELHNGGPQACLVSTIDLGAGSDPIFSLVGGSVVDQQVPAGGSLAMTVRAEASGPLPAAGRVAVGTLSLGVASATAPVRAVALSAVVAQACLRLGPALVDFGTVKEGCSSADRTVQLFNDCATPLTLVGVDVSGAAGEPAGGPHCPGPAACPEFTVVTAPSSQVIPAAGLPLTLRYHPLAPGADVGAVQVSVTQGTTLVRYPLALQGRGDLTGSNSETYTVAPSRVDALLVIDASCSMYDKQTALANTFGDFLGAADAGRVDFQLGVTTAEMDRGRGALVATPQGVKILNPGTPHLAQAFAALVNVGTGGSGRETCLEPATAALSSPLVSDPAANAGFLRPDARLAVVCVTDAVDQSPNPAAYSLARLQALKPTVGPRAMTYSVMGPFSAPTATCDYDSVADDGKHVFMTSHTGGAAEEICTADWAGAMGRIGIASFGQPLDYFLASRPSLTAGSTFTVEVNGVDVPAVVAGSGAVLWVMDAATGSVRFGALSVPQPGDTVTFRYQAACLP